MSNPYTDIAVKKIVEQEVNKVLEDIKAEMEKLAEPYKEYRYANTYISLCIKIIDKHIGKETK